MLSPTTLRNRTSKGNSTSEKTVPGIPDDKVLSHDLEELPLGVWRILLLKDSRFTLFNVRWERISAAWSMIYRALDDVYSISPRLFGLTILVHIWRSIEEPLSLYFTNNLIFLVEKRVSGGSVDDADLYKAVIFKVICLLMISFMGWWRSAIREAYSSRVNYEFQSRAFRVKLTRDLPTAQEHNSSIAGTDDVFECLHRGISLIKDAISFLLHLHLIFEIIGGGLRDGGPVFLVLCILPSVVSHLVSDDLWTKAYVAHPANEFYVRKSALSKLSDTYLKQEVLGGGASSYLISEYHKAQAGLGSTPDTGAEFLFSQKREALSGAIRSFCYDMPILYFASLALFNPSRLSIVELAVLEQTSTSLRYTFSSMAWSFGLWPSAYSRMLNLYVALDTQNQMKDGEMPYPRPGYEEGPGMAIELRNASFSYPNSPSERQALSNVSFSIQPGQLVVIVGANGSGKSTIMKLLSRFYDVTSGTILIDGIPIQEYTMETLRRGIAMLTQEHQLFPLSVRENIQLGSSDAEAMDNQRMVEASASATGADGAIKKLAHGYETVLDPTSAGYISCEGRGHKKLEAIHKAMSTFVDMSVGEEQRLVAARTFMRLFTCPIKLATVDEPSSALDPECEYRLFANLREARNGRTMIFVTHRFGHLTKYADLIVCFKEGSVVETGTHADLLAKGGEYANLYNVQAQAFTTT